MAARAGVQLKYIAFRDFLIGFGLIISVQAHIVTAEDLYVSKFHGKDTSTCGGPQEPCKTIRQVLGRLTWNDIIYLDGSMTSQSPYLCGNEPLQPLNIDKNVSLVSYATPAHLSCKGGITIGSKVITSVTVTLKGMVFNRMPLEFHGHSLKIENCAFKGCLKPVSVILEEHSSSTEVIITDSLFTENTGCLLGDIFESSNKLQLKVSIWNTSFTKNEAIPFEDFRGIISFRSFNKNDGVRNGSETVALSVTFYNITICQNKGQIVEVLLPLRGISTESYNGVNFIGNEATENSSIIESLYLSQTKFSTVVFRHTTFTHNRGIRCINISSPCANLSLHQGHFIGEGVFHGDGGAINIDAKNSLALNITETNFWNFNSDSFIAGAVYVHSTMMNISLSKLSFRSCMARFGAALYLFADEKGLYQEISFHKVEVFNCSCSFYLTQDLICGALYLISTGPGTITVSNSTFRENNKYCAISTKGGDDTKFLLSDTTFDQNSAVALRLLSIGKVDIKNSIVSASRLWSQVSAVILRDVTDVKLQYVTFQETTGRALSLVGSYNNPRVNIEIRFCAFHNNSGGHLALYGTDSANQQLNFELLDSTFFEWTNRVMVVDSQACLICINLGWYDVGVPTIAQIAITNITLGSRKNDAKRDTTKQKRSAVTLRLIYGNSVVKAHIKNSIFQNVHTEIYAAVAMVFTQRPPKSPGCKMTYPKWNQTNQVIIENTLFVGNTGGDSGALFVQNANATLKNCKFLDNFSTRGTHIYLPLGSGSLYIDSSEFHQYTNYFDDSHFNSFIYSDSENSIVLHNTTLQSDSVSDVNYLITISGGGLFSVDNSSKILCSVGGMVIVKNFTRVIDTLYQGDLCQVKVTSFTISCKICEPGFYSLRRGTSRGLTVSEDFDCFRCPYGASCTKNIKAKNGFWGSYENKNNELVFKSCPYGYCSSPPKRMLNKPIYNYCDGNRSGRLCGACATGYTSSLLSSACVQDIYCRPYLYLTVAVFLSLMMAGFLIKKPPIIPYLVDHVLWFKERPEVSDLTTSSQGNGYIKVLFYFYQVANLLLMENTAINVLRTHFIITVMKLFDFQLSDREGRLSIFGCPISGLNAITKQLLPAAGVVSVFVSIAFFYCLEWLFRKLSGHRFPSGAPYIAAAVETLLLGHVSLANAALKLLNCVSIGTARVLFIDGEVHCWQYWQTAVLVFTSCYLIPFVVVLGLSAISLLHGYISVRQFLIACIFPLPFIIYWITMKKGSDDQEANETKDAVLAVLAAPFRRGSGKYTGTVYWESVLIGRRLALVALHSFVSNYLLRYLILQFMCLILYVHHSSVNPYANSLLNRLESLSLLSHIILAAFSIAQAALSSSGAVPEGPNVTLFTVLDWIQAVILGLVPALFGILVLFAIISQGIRLIYVLFKCTAVFLVARFNNSALSNEYHTRLLEDSALNSSYSPNTGE